MVNQQLEARTRLRFEQANNLDHYIRSHRIRSFQDLALARDRTRQQLLVAMADVFDPIVKSPHQWQPMKVTCKPNVPGPAAAVVLPVSIVHTNPKRTVIRKE